MKLSIFLIVLLSACNAPKAVNQARTDENRFIQIANDKLGPSSKCEENKTETMVLCISESPSSPQQPRNTLSYMVISIKDSSVMYESSIDGGSVKWFDDEQLEVFTTPGYMRKDQTNDDFTKIYNVKTKVTTSKSEYLKK